MVVNMSGLDKNPFRAGDKVKVKMHVLRAWPHAFKNYLPVQYAVVTKVEYNSIFTDVEDTPTHFEHFEFYKEEKDMNTQTTQQTQQKTKRVPFIHELWEKYKDAAKIIYIPSGGEVLGFAYFPQADSRFRYVYLTRAGTAPTSDSGKSFCLEIPVTTKRIPFNPELKDAKVFYEKTELIEWVRMSSDVVCGVHEQLSPFKSLETALYHPNHLEMEIDE